MFSRSLRLMLSSIICVLSNSCDNETNKNIVNDPEDLNSPPIANFEISPFRGTTSTVFQFNAISSSDNETQNDMLEVRWDWTSDGTFDTDWNLLNQIEHSYEANGLYLVRLQVRDPEGLVSDHVKSILVSNESNQAFDLVAIPRGTFAMGEGGYDPIHQVTLTHDFLMSRCEITNGQYRDALEWALSNNFATITDGNVTAYGEILLETSSDYCEITISDGQPMVREAPGAGYGNFENYDQYPGLHPVKMVSWYGAACYCDWISQLEGKTPYYNGLWDQIPGERNPYSSDGYRLPTLSEWWYAASFGTTSRTYPWGNDAPDCDFANFKLVRETDDYCVGWTSAVGIHELGASELGLLDMGGNVWEWTNDWSGYYTSDAQIDPVGPIAGTYRNIKGGDYQESASGMRIMLNVVSPPTSCGSGFGFRICKSLN